MVSQQMKAPVTVLTLEQLRPKGPEDTQTAWEDPWGATQAARQTLADSQTPYGQGGVLPDVRAVGHRITEEINADPAEIERLRTARKNARAGKTFPRHSDTKLR
ncbi:MAG TPA: hypothetical protein VME19_14865 [Streptosporangiaceae bacterium]|nr:hypothetical protein [Streptosporangiaceae bacterium]